MLSRAEILARKVGHQVVDIPSGGQVTIRPITRNEALRMHSLVEAGEVATGDDYLISTALVDPEMSIEDVAQWGDTAPAGDLVALSEAVARLSGMTAGAPKSGV